MRKPRVPLTDAQRAALKADITDGAVELAMNGVRGIFEAAMANPNNAIVKLAQTVHARTGVGILIAHTVKNLIQDKAEEMRAKADEEAAKVGGNVPPADL